MNTMRNQTRILWAAAWLAAVIPARAAPKPAPHVYPSGAEMAAELASNLYLTLPPKFQNGILPVPVTVEKNMEAPVITPIAVHDGNKTLGVVSISAGYIDLLNHLAHAKAIESIQPGYFQQYVLSLARETGAGPLPEPPNIIDNRYWTDAVMNDQASYFNEMFGMTLAVSLSHHYLGYYNQYAAAMPAGKPAPFNNFIPPASWEAAVQTATLNCLECGVPVRGAKALFEALDKMPARPAWAAFFAPPASDLKKMSVQLQFYEDQYFKGQLKWP
jgi:hypothetical protein